MTLCLATFCRVRSAPSQNTSVASPNAGMRSWTYQTCAEFAYFQSTDGGSAQIFGNLIPVSLYDQICTDAFGPAFNASTIVNNVAWTNGVYGGTDIEGSNIVFPNGRCAALGPPRRLCVRVCRCVCV